MFSSLNILFLTSIGITTWILLCITNQQTNSNSEWRDAYQEYKEKRSSSPSGISIEPPKNKTIPIRNLTSEAHPKLTENLSDCGTFQYSRTVKTPFYLSYFSREQFTRLSLLCPFILAVFVIYNIMLVFSVGSF